jgi:hypothetical protein
LQSSIQVDEQESVEKVKTSRIFWSKEKIISVRNLFLDYKKRILAKTKSDFDDLKEKILNGETNKVKYLYAKFLEKQCLTRTSRNFIN